MDEICMELVTSFDISADEARISVSTTSQAAVFTGPRLVAVREHVGMYVICDDLPSDADMDDGGEYDRAMANSRPKL